MSDNSEFVELWNKILNAVHVRDGNKRGCHRIDCPFCGAKDAMSVVDHEGSFALEAYCGECDKGFEITHRK